FDQPQLILGSVLRIQDRNGLAQRFFRTIAKDAFGTAIPAGDLTVQIRADHCVVRKIDDGSQPAHGLLPFGTLADIANRGRHERARGGLMNAHAYLYRKLRAVAPDTPKLEADAHWPRLRRSEKSATITDVALPVAFRHQHFDGFAQELLASIAEAALGLRVRIDDASLAVCNHHGIGCAIEQRSKDLRAKTLRQVGHFSFTCVAGRGHAGGRFTATPPPG